MMESISERTLAAQSVQVAQPHGVGGSWKQSRRKLPATWKEWLVLVFLRRNEGKAFTEMAKSSPVVHLAGSLICIDFCFSVYLSFSPRPPCGELRQKELSLLRYIFYLAN